MQYLIVRLFSKTWSDFLCSRVYLYLTTLMVYFPVLLQILLILVKSCICFKLMWSVHSLLLFCLLIRFLVCIFDCQLSWQKKLQAERNPSFLFKLKSYIIWILFSFNTFSTLYGHFKDRVKTSCYTLLLETPGLEPIYSRSVGMT